MTPLASWMIVGFAAGVGLVVWASRRVEDARRDAREPWITDGAWRGTDTGWSDDLSPTGDDELWAEVRRIMDEWDGK